MIATFWNESWTAALVNHLWQSTIVVGVAWLLTSVLRRNHARVRYWVWLAASVKFLLPLSLLIAAGEWLQPLIAGPIIEKPSVAATLQQVAQPFAQVGLFEMGGARVAAHRAEWIPIALVAVWACGALIVLGRFARAWSRVHAAKRAARPLELPADVPALSSPILMEPGIFGVFRPVLLLPDGILEKLRPTQLASIVTHEMCHVRRRDNLTYSIHMIVEALFWFHPAVWWIGARLLEERECACDEAVLQCGSEAESYAEGILTVCKFCVESPLPCGAGVSGSDLKKRILHIMSERVVNSLGMSRKVLLGATAIAAIAIPTAMGIFRVAQTAVLARAQDISHDIPKFDVASVKPNKSGDTRFMMRLTPDGLREVDVTPQIMLTQAFGVDDDRIVGAPAWAKADRFDIQAKVAPEDAPKLDKLSRDQRFAMLQPLLENRFNLKFHHETREMRVYMLEVIKGRSKLKPVGPAGKGVKIGPGILEAQSAPIDMLAGLLSLQLGRTVIDKTGLTGDYDFSLHFTPETAPMSLGSEPGSGPDGGGPGAGAPSQPDSSGPDIFTAVREQLGLQLINERGPVDVIVIDHIEQPSPN